MATSSKSIVGSLPEHIVGTHGVVLRRLTVGDVSAIYKMLAADPEIRKYITWTAGADTEQEVECRIATFVENDEDRYAVMASGVLVGYIGASMALRGRDSEYEIGYFCDSNQRGKAIIPKATSALIAALTQYARVSSVVLYIADTNAASQAVARKLSFVRTEETAVDPILQLEERRYERVFPKADVQRNSNEHEVDILTLPDMRSSGETQSIVSAIRSNSWLHTTDVWVYRTSPKLEIMFQQRPNDSTSYAGVLDCSVAGYLEAGESPTIGGARELKEELGISVEPDALMPFGRRLNAMIDHRGRERRIVANTNILEWNHGLGDLVIDAAEVQAVFWVDAEDLLAIETGGTLTAQGIGPDGTEISREFDFDDFAYNIDSYYFRMAERLLRRVGNE